MLIIVSSSSVTGDVLNRSLGPARVPSSGHNNCLIVVNIFDLYLLYRDRFEGSSRTDPDFWYILAL